MRAPSVEKTAVVLPPQQRIRPHLSKKLIAVMADSYSHLGRIAAHPIGASLCLALGYIVLCGAYIFLSGQIAAHVAGPVNQLRNIELLKGLAFVVLTGAAYIWFSAFLLK